MGEARDVIRRLNDLKAEEDRELAQQLMAERSAETGLNVIRRFLKL